MVAKTVLKTIATLIREKMVNKTVVMAGAGISTPSGLPDFRSPGSGLYDNLGEFNLPFPTAVFDIGYFRQNQRPFFQVAKSLYPGQYPPNEAHWFVRLLNDKDLLLRMYTQNIDGLETLAGIPKEKLVEAHGTFARATCMQCRKKYDADSVKAQIFRDQIPKCEKCQGIIKPDIVFFGELLPDRFMLHTVDMPEADLVIVMGTSLEVYPFASIVEYTGQNVPRLLINHEAVGPFRHYPKPTDYVFEGDVVEGVKELVSLIGWSHDLQKLMTSYEHRPWKLTAEE